MNISLSQKNRSREGGFTLVELLVTIVIFVLLTGVVLVSQRKFDSTVLLNNLAYDTGLTIRQAQNYGVNVRVQDSALGGSFDAYGVYFQGPATGNNRNFALYVDANNDETFSGAAGNTCLVNDPECLQRYQINRGSYVSELCAGDSESSCTSVNTLNILFRRPNPDAYIYGGTLATPYNFAKITISTADGSATRSVIVTKVGQIYVKQQ